MGPVCQMAVRPYPQAIVAQPIMVGQVSLRLNRAMAEPISIVKMVQALLDIAVEMVVDTAEILDAHLQRYAVLAAVVTPS